MKLFTGKAEQDFESWYYDNEAIYDVCTKLMDDMTGNIQMFYKLPPSMQSGVYKEWLRSVGIEVEVDRLPSKEPYYRFDVVGLFCGEEIYPDHNTAQTEAIKQAGEIYNERGSK